MSNSAYQYDPIDRYRTERVSVCFNDWWEDSHIRLSIVNEIAASIIVADTEASAAWELTLLSDRIRLNVGHVEVLGVHREGIIYVLCLIGNARKLPSKYALSGNKNPAYPAVKVPSQAFYFPMEKLYKYAPLIRDAHNQFISEAASRMKVSPYRRFHSPAIVEYLKQITGKNIPQPSYFDSSRHAQKGTVAKEDK